MKSNLDREKVSNSPIGVFDSGVGGLTVVKALRRRLPGENFLYFGDTAHVPYGTKSKEAVTRFSLAIGKYLVRRGIKMLVVACNSASALSIRELRAALGIPVVGVIEAGTRAAAAATKNNIVGVIATEATIGSGAYREALKASNRSLKTVGVACPLFVPLVEEGWWNHPVTRQVAREYLKPIRQSKADTLILGCTHYPLIKPLLKSIVSGKIQLLDSAEEVAEEVARLIRERGLVAGREKGRLEFIVSDGPGRFARLARQFLGCRVPRVEVVSLE